MINDLFQHGSGSGARSSDKPGQQAGLRAGREGGRHQQDVPVHRREDRQAPQTAW